MDTAINSAAEPQIQANPGKQLEARVGERQFLRIPLRTHVVTEQDEPVAIATRYAGERTKPGDLLAMSEKIVAITQGRSYPVADIEPSGLAKLLAKFVVKTKHGIGISSPVTMELAIREAGVPRMLFAALCSALTKPFGVRG